MTRELMYRNFRESKWRQEWTAENMPGMEDVDLSKMLPMANGSNNA